MGKYISGGIHTQTIYAVELSGIYQEGVSRHEAVEAAREAGASTPDEIAAQTPITSRQSLESYVNTWLEFAGWLREGGENKIENATGENVRDFITEKLEAGISESYAATLCAAMGKFENVLSRVAELRDTGRTYDIRKQITSLRSELNQGKHELRAPVQSRAYEDPQRLIEAIPNPDHALGARLQLEGGLRVDETHKIQSGQLLGNEQIRLDDTKEGLQRVATVRPDTYAKLQERISQGGGKWGVSARGMQRSVRAAAISTGQEPKGTHGLRWNFARQSVEDKQSAGAGYSAAKKMTAGEMGHHRASITEHYLR